MFAVIKTGGKQYKVAEGDEIVIEKLDGEAGSGVTFDSVLMMGRDGEVTVGAPVVDGASVVGEITEQRKGQKRLIVKKRQRSTYRRKKGHRQHETVVRVTSILAPGETAKPVAKAAKPKAEAAPEAAPTSEAPAPAASSSDTDARGRLAAPVGAADDLKKIKGLGKVLEGKLNEAGVFHFWQIAGMTDAQVAELEEELGLAGRFERDDWKGQAQGFANEA